MSAHCKDLKADRALGEKWERRFCEHAAMYGHAFTPMQIGRTESAQAFMKTNGKWHARTLPDVTIWTCGGQHHEIKHKNPTRGGRFGLERYRFDALLWFSKDCNQNVYYTIHNHDLSGGRDSDIDDLSHWFTADIRSLDGKWKNRAKCDSYVAGNGKPQVEQLFWDTSLWIPLEEVLCPF